MKYAVIFKCKEARTSRDELFVAEGTQCILMKCEGDWVTATSSRYHKNDKIPLDVKIFNSIESAGKFMDNWNGHPWYHIPIPNSYQIIELKPVTKKIITHYKI